MGLCVFGLRFCFCAAFATSMQAQDRHLSGPALAIVLTHSAFAHDYPHSYMKSASRRQILTSAVGKVSKCNLKGLHVISIL